MQNENATLAACSCTEHQLYQVGCDCGAELAELERDQPEAKPLLTERVYYAPPLHLVSCVAGKLDRAAPAAELYQSDWFAKARAYVEATGAPWRILSAKHGLLDPAEIVEPYDETLIGKPQAERFAWGAPIASELLELAGERPIVILAGAVYREALRASPIGRRLDFRVPLQGLGIGSQKAMLVRLLGEELREPAPAGIAL